MIYSIILIRKPIHVGFENDILEILKHTTLHVGITHKPPYIPKIFDFGKQISFQIDISAKKSN